MYQLYCALSLVLGISVLGCANPHADGKVDLSSKPAGDASGSSLAASAPKPGADEVSATTKDPEHSCTARLTGKIMKDTKPPAYEIEIKNTGKREILTCGVYLYGYGPDGKVAGFQSTTANSDLKPGETFAFPLDLPDLHDDKKSIVGQPGLKLDLFPYEVEFSRNDEWRSKEMVNLEAQDRPFGGPKP